METQEDFIAIKGWWEKTTIKALKLQYSKFENK